MAKVIKDCERIKRARKKYLSTRLALDLVNAAPNSELHSAYWRTYRCRDTIIVSEGQSISTFCKNRWCLTCQSIRTATLINGYSEELAQLRDPYFVTLTAPTVPAEYLPQRIKDFGDKWRKITKAASRSKRSFKGLRKCECTVRPGGLYHYHYHIIVESEAAAVWLLRKWLQLNPEAGAAAQDMRPCNGQYLELFKYFTKLTTKCGNRQEPTDPRRLDVIFRAMKGSRVFQPFGGVRIVSEDMEEIQSRSDEAADGVYNWMFSDWIETESGEAYSGYNANTDDTII